MQFKRILKRLRVMARLHPSALRLPEGTGGDHRR